MKNVWLSITALALLACGSSPKIVPLSPEAEAVRVSKDKPQNCTDLGEVSSKGQTADPQSADVAAKTEIRNKSAGLKANYVHVEDTHASMVPDGFHVGYVTLMTGRAFKCPAP